MTSPADCGAGTSRRRIAKCGVCASPDAVRPASQRRLDEPAQQHGGQCHAALPHGLRHRRDRRPDDRDGHGTEQCRHHCPGGRPRVPVRLRPVHAAADPSRPRVLRRAQRRVRGGHPLDRRHGDHRQPGDGGHPGRHGRRSGEPDLLDRHDDRPDGGIRRRLPGQPLPDRQGQRSRPHPPVPRGSPGPRCARRARVRSRTSMAPIRIHRPRGATTPEATPTTTTPAACTTMAETHGRTTDALLEGP